MKEETIDPSQAILYKYLEVIRPPVHIRSKLDVGYDYDGSTIEFYEIRPDWVTPTIIRHHPYAKIRFIKAKNCWKLYWKRASGKWNEYEPFLQSEHLQELLDCIDEDKLGCFKG
jgi:hypothetical protein